ncbi:MAG: hypothetical protein Q4G21_03635 [Dermabacter sp.]|nr:hypothetical protein [Dermabacter sp.]
MTSPHPEPSTPALSPAQSSVTARTGASPDTSTPVLGRRAIVRGAAWAIPTVAVATAAPAFAASPCPPIEFYAKSRILNPYTDPYYSVSHFDNKVTMFDRPQGAFEMQHFYIRQKAYWRLAIGVPQGAEAGAVIDFPIDPTWTVDVIETLTLHPVPGAADSTSFSRHMPALVYNGTFMFTKELPAYTTETTATGLRFTFTEPIPQWAAGMIRITATPTVPDEDVRAGTALTAEATMTFTPLDCTSVFPEPNGPANPGKCLEDFTWTTRGTANFETNDIQRDKHEQTGKGDCSDVSIDFWVTRKDVKDASGTVTGREYTPHYRAIIGSMLDATDVVATLTLNDPAGSLFREGSLNSVQSPAAGATPEMYKGIVDFTEQPQMSADRTSISWNIGTMHAGTSVQFQADGETVVLPVDAAVDLRTSTLTVTGHKICGAKPNMCPPPVTP